MSSLSEYKCPLCYCLRIEAYFSDQFRDYLSCCDCNLVFVPQNFHVSETQEKERYDSHKNDPSDVGYRKFLSRMHDPLVAQVARGAYGLDFGCGPGPTLSLMLEESGYCVDVYDKFYEQNDSVFDNFYDFITTTEVVEHLTDPRFELERLWNMLKPGGLLGIMTKLVIDKAAFANWHYIRDMTHICFFSKRTFERLGELLQVDAKFVGNDVIFFRKPDGEHE